MCGHFSFFFFPFYEMEMKRQRLFRESVPSSAVHLDYEVFRFFQKRTNMVIFGHLENIDEAQLNFLL